MKVISWNVNGVRAAEKKGFLDFLKSSDADFVGIQETKAHKDQLSEGLTNPDGYFAYYSSAERKGYSGTALFCKQEPNEVLYGFGDDYYDNEGRMIIAEFDEFVLINNYFPNGGRDPEQKIFKMEYYDRYKELVQEYMDDGIAVIGIGDVNTAYAEIDLARPKENSKNVGFLPEERAKVGEFFEMGLIDTFRHFYPTQKGAYSYWSMQSRGRDRNVGWRIDYIFISPDILDNLQTATIHSDVFGSDHCPISIDINLESY